MELLLKLIVFLPFISALVVGLYGKTLKAFTSNLLTCAGMLASAGLSWWVFCTHDATLVVPLLSWIELPGLSLNWALRLDSLSAVMLVVITSVSAMVHVYSVGYMHEDASRIRFMAYLSLFTFMMLMLVTANNLLQLFFGWEGVGLASYLLIGFWSDKNSANAAAMKAFLTNRVGDLGLVLGLALTYKAFGTLDIDALHTASTGATLSFFGVSLPVLDAAALLLFIGAVGKSAQLGLHTWLPDAMEGPTPVSALIHAATMVTAGVFLLCRMSGLLEQAPLARDVMVVVGVLTAFFAGSVALVQNDIKRVIAYSTCSQLGLMVMACGLGAFGAAMFHLFTHAFFKALLFLGAGAVIHALHHEQDIRQMGGLRKVLPLTFALMLIGNLALAGLPPLAGYYSKDMILESAFALAPAWVYPLAVLVAGMTAFYSFRLFFMVFFGKFRGDKHTLEHAHDAPAVMAVPLLILSVGAVLAGVVYAGDFVGHHAAHFWGATFGAHHEEVLHAAHNVPFWVKKLPLVVVLASISLSALFYLYKPTLPATLAAKAGGTYRFLLHKWYIDELYDALFVRRAWQKGRIFNSVDKHVVDALPNGSAGFAKRFGSILANAQTGFLPHYASGMVMGLVLILLMAALPLLWLL